MPARKGFSAASDPAEAIRELVDRIGQPAMALVVFFASRSVPAYTGDLYITLTGGGNGTVTWDNITVPLSTVPEPGTLLMGCGLTLLLGRRHRRE